MQFPFSTILLISLLQINKCLAAPAIGLGAAAIAAVGINQQRLNDENEAAQEAAIPKTNPLPPSTKRPTPLSNKLLVIGGALKGLPTDPLIYLRFQKWLATSSTPLQDQVEVAWSNRATFAYDKTKSYAYTCINLSDSALYINKFVANAHLSMVLQYPGRDCPQATALPATQVSCSNLKKNGNTISTCALPASTAASVNGRPANAVKTMSIAVLNAL